MTWRAIISSAIRPVAAGALILLAGAAIFRTANARPGHPFDIRMEHAMTAAAPQDDVAALGKIIAIPETPVSVRFETMRHGNDGALCARLDYPAEVSGKIMSGLRVKSPKGAMLQVQLPDWLMTELDGKVTREANGLQSTDLPLYDIGGFARAPYLNGFAISPAPGRIVLCLYST